jgi:hypothetical protein
MKTTNLFTQPIPELETLPVKPSVFWYVSSGSDFRGPMFLTHHHIAHEAKHHGKHFVKPDLFVYSCLGQEVAELREKLRQGSPVLFTDEITTLTGKNYREFGINSNIKLEVSPDFIEMGMAHFPKPENAAFYFEIEVKGRDYTETQKVLYVEHDNIDFFRKVILKSYFEVVYLCATREGIAVKLIVCI